MTQPNTEMAVDPSRTPEAASGRANFDYCYELQGDGETVFKLPYLSPSFGEIRRLGKISNGAETNETIDIIEAYVRRRMPADQVEVILDVMSVDDFKGYVAFCQGPEKVVDNSQKKIS